MSSRPASFATAVVPAGEVEQRQRRHGDDRVDRTDAGRARGWPRPGPASSRPRRDGPRPARRGSGPARPTATGRPPSRRRSPGRRRRGARRRSGVRRRRPRTATAPSPTTLTARDVEVRRRHLLERLEDRRSATPARRREPSSPRGPRLERARPHAPTPAPRRRRRPRPPSPRSCRCRCRRSPRWAPERSPSWTVPDTRVRFENLPARPPSRNWRASAAPCAAQRGQERRGGSSRRSRWRPSPTSVELVERSAAARTPRCRSARLIHPACMLREQTRAGLERQRVPRVGNDRRRATDSRRPSPAYRTDVSARRSSEPNGAGSRPAR